MPTEGPNFPASTTSRADNGGTFVWSTPSNIIASDNLRAIAATSGIAVSEWLIAHAFGFAVDASDTIVGVEVSIERRRQSGAVGQVRDVDVYLGSYVAVSPPATAVSANKADTGTNWPAVEAVATYGGAADLWTASPTLTPAIVNGNAFAVLVSVTGTSASDDRAGAVDAITMTIYTTSAGGGGGVPVKQNVYRRRRVM